MGMFGLGKKPAGYYTDQTAPREPLGLGMTVDPQAMAPQESRRPGFFGKGGAGWAVLGALGDGLSQQPLYAQSMMQKRQQEQDRAQSLEDYQMQRTDKNADWIAQQQWKLNNPEPEDEPAAIQLIEAAMALPENDPKRKMIERAIPNYSMTPEMMTAKAEQQREMADYRHSLSMNLRNSPTYAQTHPTGGGGGGSLHGRSKSNPLPVGSREELAAQPKGTWVSLPNGVVVQRR